MVQAGLTPLQAIQAATVHAADLLGPPGASPGAIAAGHYADLVAVRGDPLPSIRPLVSRTSC